jgi:hypothetical protein
MAKNDLEKYTLCYSCASAYGEALKWVDTPGRGLAKEPCDSCKKPQYCEVYELSPKSGKLAES